MPIRYQKLFNLLKEKGWTTYRIRKEKLIGEGTLTALRNGTGGLDSKTLNRLCDILDCQPGDLMDYIPEWVARRIQELTELREEELREWYEDRWTDDDSYEEKLNIKYNEKYIPDEIERTEDILSRKIMDENDEEELQRYIEALNDINNDYSLAWMQKSWDKIEEKYPEFFNDIQEFFTPFIDSFNEELEEEHEDYINESVKNDLEEAKADIEKQAFEEYLSK